MLSRNDPTLGSPTRFSTPRRAPFYMRCFVSKPAFARGFTLVELMVGMVLGLIVIGGAIAIYMMVLTGATHTTREARLNQELRVAMNFMVEDIRRAGFWREARAVDFGAPGMPDHPNAFASREVNSLTDIEIHDDGLCILFSYDPTFNDGGQQVFGYRLHEGAVQMLVDPNGVLASTSQCPGNGWVELTDPGAVVVTTLTFDFIGSRCFNASRLNTENDPETPITWEADMALTPSCLAEGASGYDAQDGDILVESRQINITLSALHARDPATRINLTESVRVRNNRAYRHRDS